MMTNFSFLIILLSVTVFLAKDVATSAAQGSDTVDKSDEEETTGISTTCESFTNKSSSQDLSEDSESSTEEESDESGRRKRRCDRHRRHHKRSKINRSSSHESDEREFNEGNLIEQLWKILKQMIKNEEKHKYKDDSASLENEDQEED